MNVYDIQFSYIEDVKNQKFHTSRPVLAPDVKEALMVLERFYNSVVVTEVITVAFDVIVEI